MTATPQSMAQVLAAANSIVPVITLADVAAAEPLSEILLECGFPVLEITLRTPAGLGAIERAAATHSELLVGAGTVLTADQVTAAVSAGARFIVSPGFSEVVHSRCQAQGVPYLPGIATITEAISAAQLGYGLLKLFPANTVGGISMLKALHAVLPELSFCPTGGVDGNNAKQFLECPNVVCVGGSWLAPSALIEEGQWQAIRALANGASSNILSSVGSTGR